MKFYKYQGAGNDFLIADNRDGHITEKDGVLTALLPDGSAEEVSISELCDRRYGVGADGLMLLDDPEKVLPEEGTLVEGVRIYRSQKSFRMTYYNSDGSGGMMCGNGGRCIVAFAADRGITDFCFHAADGYHSADIISDDGRTKIVSLKMKDVASYEHYEGLSGVSVPSDGYFLDTGTRHYVRIVENLETYDVVGEGRDIRYNASELQPVGANVNFIEPAADGWLKVRTYEKGVEDETFACGTGIVASCIAAYKAGIRPSESCGHDIKYNVIAKRDRLSVSFRPLDLSNGIAEDVYLTGPATYVAEINVDMLN